MPKLIALFLLLFLTACNSSSDMQTDKFDWQGHRGCRGLYPENTIPAFLHALSYPEVTTLELDIVISKENRVIVSHDPWMSAEICLSPQGDSLEKDSRRSLLDMRLDEIQAYDCGNLFHPHFPEQQKMKVVKPTLEQVFAAVKEECARTGRQLPGFNIELKYLPEWEAAGLVPAMQDFIEATLFALQQWNDKAGINLQCFHPPILELLHAQAPEYSLAYLDEFPEQGSIEAKMEAIGFRPQIYSPYYLHLTAEHIKTCHDLGMKVIPWTVNDVTDLKRIKNLGVDGIITDYPDRIQLSSTQEGDSTDL